MRRRSRAAERQAHVTSIQAGPASLAVLGSAAGTRAHALDNLHRLDSDLTRRCQHKSGLDMRGIDQFDRPE